MRASAESKRSEKGSALMLMPAAVLILFMLASIAVDSALIFLGQRELRDFTDGLSNDLATQTLDERSYYGDANGPIVLSQIEADRRTESAASALDSGTLGDLSVTSEVSGRTVTVSGSARIRLIFAPAIPGIAHFASVKAVSAASLR